MVENRDEMSFISIRLLLAFDFERTVLNMQVLSRRSKVLVSSNEWIEFNNEILEI